MARMCNNCYKSWPQPVEGWLRQSFFDFAYKLRLSVESMAHGKTETRRLDFRACLKKERRSVEDQS
jgi:hypothetical protein